MATRNPPQREVIPGATVTFGPRRDLGSVEHADGLSQRRLVILAAIAGGAETTSDLRDALSAYYDADASKPTIHRNAKQLEAAGLVAIAEGDNATESRFSLTPTGVRTLYEHCWFVTACLEAHLPGELAEVVCEQLVRLAPASTEVTLDG